MTRGQFILRVSRKVGLTLDNSDELTFLQDTFYDAIVEVLLATHCYVEMGNMTLASGTAEYRTDPNILAVLNHKETSGGNPFYYPEVTSLGEVRQLQTFTQSGSPVRKMAIEGNLLVVWPTPSSADVIAWDYVPLPTKTANDTDDSKTVMFGGIPVYAERALEYYGLWQASEYDERAGGFWRGHAFAPGAAFADLFNEEIVKVKKRYRHMSGRGIPAGRIGYPGRQTRIQHRNDVFPS